MANAADLLHAYREQAGTDEHEAAQTLLDFFDTFGMLEEAAAVLCDYIDEQGIANDFANELRENGLVIGPGQADDD